MTYLPPGARSRIGLAMTLAVSAAALTACSSAESANVPDSFEGLELTAWNGVPYEPFASVNKKQLEECAAEIGATITSETFPADQLVPKVLQAGSSKSLPDLVQLDGADIARVADTGILTDLADYGISGEGLDPKALSLGQYDGTLYGLTPSVNTVALFYNKAMFAEAGLQPPATFDELRETASALTTADRHGIALAGDNKGTGAFVFLPFLLSAGGDPADLTSAGAVEALELWNGLVEDGSLSQEMVNWGWDAPDQFISGKAAMTVSGPWTVGNLEGSGIDFGVVPIPTDSASRDSVSPIGGESWTVPVTDATRQAAAAKVVECLGSAENQMEHAVTGLRIPSLTATAEEYAAETPEIEAFVEQIPASYNRSAQLGDTWNQLTVQYGSAIQYAIAGGDEPAVALQKASGE